MIKDQRLRRLFCAGSLCICMITVVAMTALWGSGYPLDDTHKDELLAYIDRLSASQAATLINLNTADQWRLQSLPSIGEVRAKAIVDYRTRIGSFTSIEQLLEVKGISQSVYDKIKDLVTL